MELHVEVVAHSNRFRNRRHRVWCVSVVLWGPSVFHLGNSQSGAERTCRLDYARPASGFVRISSARQEAFLLWLRI